MVPDALDIYRHLGASFGVELEPTPKISMEDVRRFVRDHVEQLLKSNPALLMSILYRIDVAEAKVQHAVEHVPPTELPDRLTDLIIERQLEKPAWRERTRERDSCD